MYKQGSELIGHELRKYLIKKEYGITDKPITSGNPMSNAVLEKDSPGYRKPSAYF